MYNIDLCSKKLSANLIELRKQCGYTQKYVATALGIAYQSYQAYETGKNLPSLPSLILLAELYDVSLDYLIGRKDY